MPVARTEVLDTAPIARRRRRWADGDRQPLATLPAEWRDLAARWLRRGQATATGCRWDTLAKDGGPESFVLGQKLLDWLVDAGWMAVIEERRHGMWSPVRIEFTDRDGLRAELGLPDPQASARRWAELRARLDPAGQPEITVAIAALDPLPAARAADRAELLLALLRWRSEGRGGTRRDFAHFARGATKSVTDAEWRWLEETVDLGAFAIERHTPLLLLAAPLDLELAGGVLGIGSIPDFASLTPATVAAATAARGSVREWQLVENRTSFERVARSRPADAAVVWLPGFPAHWWRDAVARLLALAPAPARIACDPDPAGIAIAMEAGALWTAAGSHWQPWHMDASDLARLRSRQPLSDSDHELLRRLMQSDLPPTLAGLANWMSENGEKGEQEGYL